jgi:hypothetical protein
MSACKGKQNEDAQREDWNAVRATKAVEQMKPAIVIWTGVDPLDPLARALEQLIDAHNDRNKERWATLKFVDSAKFAERAFAAGQAELPPDLLIVPSPLALEMARRGLLLPVGNLLERAKIEPSEIYPAAWKTLESPDGRLWGLPLCAEMKLRFVNLDRLEQGGFATETLGSVPLEGAKWAEFLAGGLLQCEAGSTRLRELEEKAPHFHWRAYAMLGGKNVSSGSYVTLGLVIFKGTSKPLDSMFPLCRLSLQPGFSQALWVQGSRLPVRRPASAPELARLSPSIGSSLDEWMRSVDPAHAVGKM